MRLQLAILGAMLFPATGVCDALQDAWCVDALEQILALKTASPIFKVSGAEKRYMEDADRPAEIARLQKIVETSCSTEPKKRATQEANAYQLHVWRSPECRINWEMLADMEQPGSRNPEEDIERQRKIATENCPRVRLTNRWLVLYAGSMDEPPKPPPGKD